MLAWVEKEWKRDPSIHDHHARVVNEVIGKYALRSVTEVGCGTGELANRLKLFPIKGYYDGYDLNESCIEYANSKSTNDKLMFKVADVRSNLFPPTQLTLSFGFLKHFGLHEWSTIFNKVASFGEYFIFDMPISAETHDDGVEHHHVWKSVLDLDNDIRNAGFLVLDIDRTNPVEPVFVCKRK